MAYFVFDMDETLAQVYTPFYYICSLRPEKFYKNLNAERNGLVTANTRTATFRERLGRAYEEFVRLIAEKEKSDSPLGLLRPGILRTMRNIYEFQQTGQAKCAMIYSNNGSLPMLELVRDVIHSALGITDLIRDCVHWYHPTRIPERTGGPGSARKTWPILKKLLEEGPCGAVDVKPSQVMFFDDMIHPDLYARLSHTYGYFKVIEYKYKTPCSEYNPLYREALTRAGILGLPDGEEEQTFLNTVADQCQTATKDSTFEDHLDLLKDYTGATAPNGSSPPALADTANLLLRVTAFGNRFPVVAVAPNTNSSNPLSAIQTNLFGGKKSECKTRKHKGKAKGKNRKTRSRK